jgi:hypothetical protein
VVVVVVSLLRIPRLNPPDTAPLRLAAADDMVSEVFVAMVFAAEARLEEDCCTSCERFGGWSGAVREEEGIEEGDVMMVLFVGGEGGGEKGEEKKQERDDKQEGERFGRMGLD